MTSSIEREEYQRFLEESATVDRFEELRRVLSRDLVSSKRSFLAYYLLLCAVGYLVSLAVCSQNAFGFFRFSDALAMSMCVLPKPFCWVACGCIFSGVPFLLSLFLLNRFRHRYLLIHFWWLVALVPMITSGFIVVLPPLLRDFGILKVATMPSMLLSNPQAIFIWLLSALATPYILESVVYVVLKMRR